MERTTVLKLLKKSLAAEENAYHTYVEQSRLYGEEMKRFFLKIAKEEKKHMDMISEIIKKLEKSSKRFV